MNVETLPKRVIVACTATLHGHGTVRLPDRLDPAGSIAAFSVETSEGAKDLFRELDIVGRELYVDVERKQIVNIVGIARECIKRASLYPHKPNDATVRSLDVLVTHLAGPDLLSRHVGIVGMGNIGFKAALLLAERGASVAIYARRSDAALRSVLAINAILPRHSPSQVEVWMNQQVDIMVSAVSARGVVGSEWLTRLAPGAFVLDVGIGNLSEEFLDGALTLGAHVLRLDASASGSQLNAPAPDFFERRFGRGQVGGVPIVSGGIVGSRGTVVVDSFAHPTRIFGLADGVGGLLPPAQMTNQEKESVGVVQTHLSGNQARH